MTQRTAASGSRIDGIGLMIGSIHSSITRQHRLGTKWPSMHAVYGDPQVFGWLCRPIAVRRWGSDRDKLPRSLGRVAEWQTRWLQVPVSFGTWGFKSPSPTRSGSRNSAIRGQELERVPDLLLCVLCWHSEWCLRRGSLGQESRLSAGCPRYCRFRGDVLMGTALDTPRAM